MASTSSIKVNFLDGSDDVEIALPPTLEGLQEAVGSTFGVDLPARSGVPGADGDLCFTYKDPDGDDIVFDMDSELKLALRLCPDTLEISAAVKEKKKPEKRADGSRIYRVAARTMREYHGVPSMTPPKLINTLALLKLGPDRLVAQGLAPPKLLLRLAKKSRVALGSSSGGEENEDLEETVTADMELMTVESNHGVEAVDDDENPAESDASIAVYSSPSSSEDESEAKGDSAGKPKRVIHAVFLARGIKIRPRETRPLLLALGVHPHRLVKLGLVDASDLPAKRGRAQHRHGAYGPHMGGPHMGHGGKPYGSMYRHAPAGLWVVGPSAPPMPVFGSFDPKGDGKGFRGPHPLGGGAPMHMQGPPAMMGCLGGGDMWESAAPVHGPPPAQQGPPPGHHGFGGGGGYGGGGCGGAGQQQFQYYWG